MRALIAPRPRLHLPALLLGYLSEAGVRPITRRGSKLDSRLRFIGCYPLSPDLRPQLRPLSGPRRGASADVEFHTSGRGLYISTCACVCMRTWRLSESMISLQYADWRTFVIASSIFWKIRNQEAGKDFSYIWKSRYKREQVRCVQQVVYLKKGITARLLNFHGTWSDFSTPFARARRRRRDRLEA